MMNPSLVRIYNVQQSLSVHLLGGGEHDHLEPLGDVSQNLLNVWTLPDEDVVKCPVEIDFKRQIRVGYRINGAVNESLVQIKNKSWTCRRERGCCQEDRTRTVWWNDIAVRGETLDERVGVELVATKILLLLRVAKSNIKTNN
jgi:hypothetical protein